MSDVVVVVAPAAAPVKKGRGAPKKAAAPKTPKAPKVKKPRAPRPKSGGGDHPKVSVMVNGAIKGLAERGGSSLKAIKKYIHDTYKVSGFNLSFLWKFKIFKIFGAICPFWLNIFHAK
jgi:hypothetical protein